MRFYPPGSKRALSVRNFFAFRRDPLAFLSRVAQRGDVTRWEMLGREVLLVNHPELIRTVLVTDDDKFDKLMDASDSLLGKGLTASRAVLHREQRRVIQPGFRADQIAKFAETMVDRADRVQKEWRDGEKFDIKLQMERVALDILGATLLSQALGDQAPEISQAMTMAIGAPPNMIMLGKHAKWIEKLPFPGIRRASAGRATLHALTERVIRARRADKTKPNDLLTMMLNATDTGDGNGMSVQQLHDEVTNLIIGGFETVSNALTWIWFRLSQHPEARKKLHDELDRVLGDRLPTFSDFPNLNFAQGVVREALRLHPPLWIIWRETLQECRLNGSTAAPRSIVLICQYLVHRDERFFPEPLAFKPERWTTEFREALPKFAYFPFGGGSRQCIGDRFGFMEAVLVLATVSRRWTMDLEPGFPVVEQPMLTLRPKNGMRMSVHAR